MTTEPKNLEMGTNLSIPLNIDPKADSFVIKGGSGVAVAHVKKASGEVLSIRIQAKGSLKTMTSFDPSSLTVHERRNLECEMYGKGHTQADIADILGISQSTVAHDIKVFKASEKKDENHD